METRTGRGAGDLVRALAAAAHEHWHSRRAELFLELMRPRTGVRILDLGGAAGGFMARVAPRLSASVTVADITPAALAAAEEHGFEPVILPEEGPLPFPDGAFDVVFCNSVIEHVTGPKAGCAAVKSDREWRERAFRAQDAFAREIRRVGRSYFVQTPYRHFPVDAHTWLPFTNWLTHPQVHRLVQYTDRHWVKKCEVADWSLLGYAEMRKLFPDARIHTERVVGLPKSIIAYKAA